MSEENGNGNLVGLLKPTSSSNEDLSEYTDADESISAPTEFLAEVSLSILIFIFSIVYLRKRFVIYYVSYYRFTEFKYIYFVVHKYICVL